MEKVKDFFDDYNFKDTTHRVALTFRQIKEKILSPWEISKFLNNFNTYYYKAEVFNTIGIALNNGIKPENILILDESFKVDHQYLKINQIDCKSENLQYLYTIGKPISLFPNQEIIFLNSLFKHFRFLNEALYQSSVKSLSLKKLFIYFNAYLGEDKELLFILLKEDTNELISKSSNKDKKDQAYHKINTIIAKFQAEEKQKNNEFSNLKLIQEKIENRQKLTKYEEILYKQYFQKFYFLLRDIQRPLVGVYDEETKQISVLCRAHINKKDPKSVTLDLKYIKHNSPIEGVLVGGAAIYSTIQDEKRKDELHKYDKKIKEKELLLLDKKLREQDLKNHQLEMENMQKGFAVLQTLMQIEQNDEINAVAKVQNPYIKEQLQIEYSNMKIRAAKLMRDNNFRVDPAEIKVYQETSMLDIKV